MGALGAIIGGGLGYGFQKTYFDREGGTLSQNTRAFYKGLFGGSGYIYGIRDPMKGNVLVPEIWKGFKIPKLVDRVEGFKFKWQDYSVAKLVTEGLAAKNPEYLKMDRIVPPMVGQFIPLNYAISDNIRIEIPDGPANSINRIKTKWNESAGAPWAQNIHLNSTGQKLKVTLSNSLNDPMMVNSLHWEALSLPQSKFTIHFQSRVAVPIKRLRVLGIKF